MTRTLLLSGGIGHPAAATVPGLTEALGGDLVVETDIERGLERLHTGDIDLLAVNALAFGMADDRYDVAQRDEYAFTLSTRGRDAIERWVGAGRPLLALHTAVICFDDWPRWAALIGGSWDWGRSSHPPVEPLTVHVDGLAGAPPVLDVVDERYSDLWLADDIEIVARCDGHPSAWRRTEGSARIACSLLGHDARSLDNAAHRSFLRALRDWLLGDR